jgi:hypothetical protein
MHDSVEAVLLLRPDWLRKRIVEAATWADAELSKATGGQIPMEQLLRGDPSRELRSDALDLHLSGPIFFAVGTATFRLLRRLCNGGQS